MPDRDRDLTGIFVRDLDEISLPPREAWRPVPRQQSTFMKATGYVMTSVAVAAVLIAAMVWSFSSRPSTVAAPQSAASASASTTSATPSSRASAPATAVSLTPTPTAREVSSPRQPTGTITGQLGYPSDFVPPLTIYAISVNDPNVWYSTRTPYFGNFTRPTPSPTPSAAATWPPQGAGFYQLTVPSGLYYVIAYSDDAGLSSTAAAGYTRYTVDCIQKTQNNSTPPTCSASDHSLVAVAVRDGTVTGIDIKDWYAPPGQSYPPRPTPTQR